MRAEDLIRANMSEIASLCEKYGVERLRLFGSALREDWDPKQSDVDFLADFGVPPEGVNLFDQQFGFLVDLEKLLGCEVDVVDWKATKNQTFRQAVDPIAREVYAA